MFRGLGSLTGQTSSLQNSVDLHLISSRTVSARAVSVVILAAGEGSFARRTKDAITIIRGRT